MNRIVMMATLAVAGPLVAAQSAVPALAGPGGAHTTSRAYTGGGFSGVAVVPGIRGHGHAQGTDLQAVVVPTAAGDRRVRVTVADAAGGPVLMDVTQQTPDGRQIDVAEGCGAALSTKLPRPGQPVTVYLLAGPCDDGVSTPTTGEVTFRFSR